MWTWLSALAIALSSLGPASVAPCRPILAADVEGRLILLDGSGRFLRRVAGPIPGGGSVEGVDLSPDARTGFVAVYHSAPRADALYRVDLATGRARRIAVGLSPAVSPDGTRLAYLRTATRTDAKLRVALVVRDRATGHTRAFRLGRNAAVGTPPELILNWSPDGRRIALLGTRRERIVDVGHAGAVDTAPTVPGLAPVFLSGRTLVVLENCCVGRQALGAVDLPPGRRRPFATLSSPPEWIRRRTQRTIVAVTALHELVLVSAGAVRVLRTGVVASSG